MSGARGGRLECLGVDAGASLLKLGHAASTGWVLRTFASGQVDALLAYAHDTAAPVIGVTGGGGRALAEQLPQARLVGEFEAWVAGAPQLAELADLELPETYLLVSVGTGVSVNLVRGASGTRVGGTALGGGSLVGLAQLLLGTRDFDEIVALAALGDRSRVDLSIGDVYGGAVPPPLADAPASHFAKLESTSREDLAAALVGAIGHNLGLICGQLARSHGARAVVYCGSTVANNAPLQQVLAWQTGVYGAAVQFPAQGAYCGALGAAVLAAA
jgi:type II pantothenate kinase